MATAKEILFGGTPSIPSDEVFAEVRRNWSPQMKILNEAIEIFRKSADNNGTIPDDGSKPATLEQVWNFMNMLGASPYCLLSTDQPAVDTGAISKVIRLTAHQLTEALKQISVNDGGLSTLLLHYDGQTGHCINVQYYDVDEDRFVYRDPWPLDSLLCSQNNIAGVNAVNVRKGVWSVTASEMETVVFAAMLLPSQWERFQDNIHPLYLDEIMKTDFFSFFHLTQIAAYESEDGEEVQYSPSSFKGIVVVSFKLNKTRRVKAIKLLMNGDWMKQHYMLVPDITRSFLQTFVPEKDRPAFDEIIQNMSPSKLSILLPQLMGNDNDRRDVDEILLAYAGVISQAYYPATFCSLSIENTVIQNIQGQVISLNLP